jgi:hypothetical protein
MLLIAWLVSILFNMQIREARSLGRKRELRNYAPLGILKWEVVKAIGDIWGGSVLTYELILASF